MNDGLPSSQIYDVHLDEDGFVWFATAYGLVKFDGYEFETYGVEDGLRDELIYDIFEDSQKQFWVSTEMGGVGTLESDSVIYSPEYSRFDTMLVNYITESPRNELWFGTNGQGVFIRKDSSFLNIDVESGMPSNQVWDIQFMSNGQAWIATMQGVAVYEHGKGIIRTWTKSDGLSGTATYQAFEARDGTIWIPTNNGITTIKDGEINTITEINGERLRYVYNINQDEDGVIWIGTERRGLYWYDQQNDTYTHITKKNGLSSNYIYRLIKAIDGTIWIATDGNGVSIFKDKKFKFYDLTSDVQTNSITSLYTDEEGAMWYGSEKGLGRYKDGEFQTFEIPESIFSDDDEIWDIEPLPNGNLLLLTYTYWLIEFDGENFFRSEMNEPLMDYFLTDIMVDNDGQIWLGSGRGLVKYNSGEDYELIKVSDEYWQNVVTLLYQDSEGTFWVGTEGGVAKYESGEFEFYTETDGLKGQSVYELKEDSRGNLWVGTNKGLSVLSNSGETEGPPEIHSFETDDVFLPETISLAFDNDGGLWQGTNGGLNYYDVEGWYSSGSMDKMHFALQDYGKGVEFNGNASVVDEDGTLWFGTTRNGLLKYEKTEDFRVTQAYPPLTFIRRILVNGERVYEQKLNEAASGSIELEYFENNLEIEYGAVNYKDPYRIFYRYKLEGFDEDWSSGFDRREAVYTNLDPGTYTFMVQSKSTTSDWSSAAVSMDIEIKKPFWLNWWFIILVCAAVISLVLLYIDIYLNIAEKKKLKVLVDEQTKDLQNAVYEKEILIKEIHHRVKNNMAVVSGMLDLQSWQMEEGEARDAIENSKLRIKTMSTIHEKLYQNKDLANIDFHEFVNDLIYNISTSLKGNGQDITVEQELEVDQLDVNKAIPCGLLLNELICNSFEHAFPDGQSGLVSVSVKDLGKRFKLVVKDDGVGIPKDILESERSSLGITLVQSLADQLEADLEITNGTGTTVTLIFDK